MNEFKNKKTTLKNTKLCVFFKKTVNKTLCLKDFCRCFKNFRKPF